MGPFWTFLMISSYLDVFGTLNHFLMKIKGIHQNPKSLGDEFYFTVQPIRFE